MSNIKRVDRERAIIHLESLYVVMHKTYGANADLRILGVFTSLFMPQEQLSLLGLPFSFKNITAVGSTLV